MSREDASNWLLSCMIMSDGYAIRFYLDGYDWLDNLVRLAMQLKQVSYVGVHRMSLETTVTEEWECKSGLHSRTITPIVLEY